MVMVGLFRFVCFVLVCIARKIWEIAHIYIYNFFGPAAVCPSFDFLFVGKHSLSVQDPA